MIFHAACSGIELVDAISREREAVQSEHGAIEGESPVEGMDKRQICSVSQCMKSKLGCTLMPLLNGAYMLTIIIHARRFDINTTPSIWGVHYAA